MKRIEAGRRLRGPAADAARGMVVEAYTVGRLPIRAIASGVGRSYGWVHRTLTMAGVQMRPRGGAGPRPQ